MSEQDMSQRKQRTPQMTELRSLRVDHRCSESPNENQCSEVVKEICAAATGTKRRSKGNE